MARAIASTVAFWATRNRPAPLDALRSLIVCSCALSLIAAGFLR